MKRTEYHSDWLPLDEHDEGYQQYNQAKSVLRKREEDYVALLGGLDRITITDKVVRFYDRGMNGKTLDVIVNLESETIRVV